MKALQLITQGRGGPVDHAVSVARELAAQGHDSHVAGPPGAYVETLAGTGVTVHEVDIASKSDVRGALAFRRMVRTLRPDVVHCQDRRAGLVGRTVLTGLPVAAVYTLHGVPDSLSSLVPSNEAVAPRRRSESWQNLQGERLLARRRGTRIVTPCQALADYAVRHVGIPHDRVSVVYNGVDDQWLAGSRRRSEPAPHQPTRLLWVGVMQPVKQLPRLIAALAEVPDSRLLLVGDGPERRQVERTITEHQLRDRVDLVGFQQDPRPFFNDADVLVLPSGAEACPMVILQAMATGPAIVASRVGGIGEVVRDQVDGLLVGPGDPADLVDALSRVSRDPALRHELRTNARSRVQQSFTIQHTVGALLPVYANAGSEVRP